MSNHMQESRSQLLPLLGIALAVGLTLFLPAVWLLTSYPVVCLFSTPFTVLPAAMLFHNRHWFGLTFAVYGSALLSFGIYMIAVLFSFGPGYGALLFEDRWPLPELELTSGWMYYGIVSLITGLTATLTGIFIGLAAQFEKTARSKQRGTNSREAGQAVSDKKLA